MLRWVEARRGHGGQGVAQLSVGKCEGERLLGVGIQGYRSALKLGCGDSGAAVRNYRVVPFERVNLMVCVVSQDRS